jgi:cytochrome c oxidase cbb3-type subunit III
MNPQPDTQDEPRLTGHCYDGIEEYDNPMPGWWSWLFVATIVFAAGYFFIAILAGGQMSAQGSYDRAVAEELKRQMAGGALKADAATILTLSKDADTLKAGQAIFATNCVACHNRDGSGLIGPNLTDDYYINVNSIADIPDVVTKGRNNGAMPTWGNRLSPNDIVQVSAYVASLRGQNKPSVRPPEGKIIPPWSEH